MYEDKFTKIFESNFQRFQGGGILPGDVVKLIDGMSNHDWFSGQHDGVKDKLNDLLDSDLNIRVISVRGKIAAAGGDVQQDNQSEDFYCDIAHEMAPGLFTDPITIPIDMLEIVDTGNNLPPIPDSQRYDDRSHIEPKEPELTEGEDESCPMFGTHSQRGDKKLAVKDTAGFGKPGKDHMNTSEYMK